MKKSPTSRAKAKEIGFASVGGVRRRINDPAIPDEVLDGWIRGQAIIEGDEVVLKSEGRSTYYPEKEQQSVLLAFVNLEPTNSLEVVRFVKQYGLLLKAGLEASREPLESWELSHDYISGLLQLHATIQAAKRDEVQAFNRLAKIPRSKYRRANQDVRENQDLIVRGVNATELFTRSYEEGFWATTSDLHFSKEQKAQLLRMAMIQFSDLLKLPLGSVIFGLSCDPFTKSKTDSSLAADSLRLDFRAPDLLSYLSIQVAFLGVDNAPIAQCICGKFYEQTRTDKKYCSEACGGNARSKKNRELDRQRKSA